MRIASRAGGRGMIMTGATLKRVACIAVVAVAVPLLIACGGGAKKDGAGSSAPASGTAQTSDAPVKPKVDRLVMAVSPPQRESNEPRMYGQPDAWQLRPMYE